MTSDMNQISYGNSKNGFFTKAIIDSLDIENDKCIFKKFNQNVVDIVMVRKPKILLNFFPLIKNSFIVMFWK